jgi:membrane protease YdiL (CAAX protease family)
MLVVWLLFPLAGELFEDPSTALLSGSLAASLLVVSQRRPAVPSLSVKSGTVLAGTMLVGVGVVQLADLAWGQLGLAAVARPKGSTGPAHVFSVVVLAPIFEELLYREYLLGVLHELWGWLPALALSSALFGLGHMQLSVVPIAFAGGLVCGLVMLRTGSLAAVIGLHAGWNLGMVCIAWMR